MNKKGFTLAEVLITLGIIGIIATMTIPTLMANYQKTIYATGLKEAYSIFNQALLNLTRDYDCPGDLACTGLLENKGYLLTLLPEAIVKYFKVVKNCGQTADQGCLSDKVDLYYDGTANNSNYDMDGMGWYSFITADGISFAIQMLDNGGTSLSKGVTNDMTKVHGQLIVDVNGPNKGPNYLGRDIFWFFITNGHGAKIYPVGGADDGWFDTWQNQHACQQINRDSHYCTGRIMDEGWQMKY